MGIERFFSSIQYSSITNENKFLITKKLKMQSVYIDFNSEIHTASSQIVSDINNSILESVKNNSKIQDYTEVDIENKIIESIKKRVINIVKIFTDRDLIKKLYISIDGVPTVGKIMEQKRRRYLSFVLSSIKDDIFTKYKNGIDSKRRKFIEKKIRFDKIKISPATEFMYRLEKELKSDRYVIELKKELKSLKDYKVSGYNEYGEGEMKIFWKAKNDSLIVSPDSDVTLLGLLLSRTHKNIKILRFNQQKNIYETIDIDILKNNLLNYCGSTSSNTITDLVTIFTFFGNDFVPKLVSINVKSGFKTVIDNYNKISKNGFLVNGEDIDCNFFLELLKLFSKQEEKSLQESYAEKNYKNYNYIKSIIGTGTGENFIDNIKNFLSDLKEFNENKKTKNFITNDFIYKLRRFVRAGETFKNDQSFINSYHHYKKIKRHFPKVEVLFKRYSDITYKKFPNRYEEEIYKLENIKGDYKKLLGIKNLELGKIYIDDNYRIVGEDIKNAVKKYYGTLDKNKVIKQYLTAFIYTFRHYILSTEFTNVVWYYPFNRSPLVSDIYDFLKNNPNFVSKIKLKTVKNYFTSVQHLVYTSPVEEFKPEEYRKKVSKKYIEKLKKSIDCTDQIFISKCFIETYDDEPEEFIKKTDKIKKSVNTLKLIGTFDSDNITVYSPITMDKFNKR